MNGKRVSVVGSVLLWCVSAFALGPHELVVVARKGSQPSVDLAERYMQWRKIPACNLVLVHLPDDVVHGVSIGRDDFRTYIIDPVRKAITDRNIADHILAWAYSTDFPTRISTPEGVSLMGATFLRGDLPDPEVITKGAYASPLFAGPERADGSCSAPQTFGRSARLLGHEMPLPSMMLGYTGPRGNTIDEVNAALQRGVASDATHPSGQVYFVTNSNVRSRCRAWQYEGARRELAREGVAAVVTGDFPVGKTDVAGLMTGSAVVAPETIGAFVPGAMADHLTSFAGAFDQADQSKMSLWIKAGATLTAGTVVEPRAMVEKFPAARFYYCYARGCTAIESFFLSVKCPLQILLLGDPLASPWTTDDRISIDGVPATPARRPFIVSAALELTDPMRYYSLYLWLVDGRTLAEGREITVDPAGLSDGVHTLRVVAYGAGLVRPQVFAVERFVVAHRVEVGGM